MDKQSVERVIQKLVVKLEAGDKLTALEDDIISTNRAVMRVQDDYDRAYLRRVKTDSRYRESRDFVARHTPKTKSRTEDLKNVLTAQLVYLCALYSGEKL